MKVGSLFSGIGGIELGFERQGFTTKWFVEKDAYAQAVLRKNFPNIPIYDDITTLDFSQVEKVDILTGGFPCQDISIAGKGVGISGERSGLWKYYAKAIRILRPKFALIENVSAITHRGLNVVLADLAEEGYDAEWFDLRASDFGALHRRERIFIIAYTNRGGRWSKIRSEEENTTEVSGRVISTQEHPHSNTNKQRCDNSRDNRKERHLLQTQEWKVEEEESERNRRKPRANEGVNTVFANPNRERLEEARTEQQTTRNCGYSENTPHFAYNLRHRVERFKQETFQKQRGFSWCQNVRSIKDLQKRPDIPEPLIRRKDHGLPNRMDQTKCLGNAVVPVVAEFIAKIIKEKRSEK